MLYIAYTYKKEDCDCKYCLYPDKRKILRRCDSSKDSDHRLHIQDQKKKHGRCSYVLRAKQSSRDHQSGNVQQGTRRTGQTQEQGATVTKERHHQNRQVLKIRTDRGPCLRRMREQIPKMYLVTKRNEADRVAVQQQTRLRNAILQELADN